MIATLSRAFSKEEQAYINTLLKALLRNHLGAFSKQQNKKEQESTHFLPPEINLAVRIALTYAYEFRIPVKELLQEAFLGLLEAANSSKRKKDNLRFCMIWVLHKVRSYIIKNFSIVPLSNRNVHNALFFRMSSLSRRLTSQNDTYRPFLAEERLVEFFHAPLREIKEVESYLANSDLTLDRPIIFQEKTSKTQSWSELLLSGEPSIEEVSLNSEKTELIKKVVHEAINKCLKERDAYILKLRMRNGKSMTLETIGTALSITKERVRQIEKRALKKVREYLAHNYSKLLEEWGINSLNLPQDIPKKLKSGNEQEALPSFSSVSFPLFEETRLQGFLHSHIERHRDALETRELNKDKTLYLTQEEAKKYASVIRWKPKVINNALAEGAPDKRVYSATLIRQDISEQELLQAASKTPNETLRKRWLALAAIRAGKSINKAAKEVGIWDTSLYPWLKDYNRHGLRVSEKWRVHKPRRQAFLLNRDTDANKLRALATQETSEILRIRFLTIAELLEGKKASSIVRKRGITCSIIQKWVDLFNEFGIDGLYQQNSLKGYDDNVSAFVIKQDPKEIAALEEDRNIRIQLQAIGGIRDGKSIVLIAEEVGVSAQTIAQWSKIYNKEGVKGLYSNSNSPNQKNKLLRLRLDISLEEIKSRAEIEEDLNAKTRLFAIAALREGQSPTQVVKDFKIHFYTLLIWAQRFNEAGLKGLSSSYHLANGSALPRLREDITAQELRVLTAREENAQVRGILLALAELKEGKDIPYLTHKFETTATVIYKWIDLFNEGGIKRLQTFIDSSILPYQQSSEITSLNLRSLAQNEKNEEIVLRMEALARLQEGQSRRDVCRDFGISLESLRKWKLNFRKNGIIGLYPREASISLDNGISAQELRALAKNEIDTRLQKRYLVIADLKEGYSQREVMQRHDVNVSFLRFWKVRFRENGIKGLKDKEPPLVLGFPLRVHIDLQELDELISQQKDLYKKERLEVIKALLSGTSPKEVAKLTGVSMGTLWRWSLTFRKNGVQGLLSLALSKRLKNNESITPQINVLPEDLFTLAKQQSKEKIQTRLLTIAEVLEGKTKKEVAKKYKIRPGTLTEWIKQLNALGLKEYCKRTSLKEHKIPLRGYLKPHILRSHLNKAPDTRAEKKVLVLQDIRAGRTYTEISKLRGVSCQTIQRWVKIANATNIESLVIKKKPPRPTQQRFLEKIPIQERSTRIKALHFLACRKENAAVKGSLLAIASLLNGGSYENAALIAGIKPNNLRLTINRYLKNGPKGLLPNRKDIKITARMSEQTLSILASEEGNKEMQIKLLALVALKRGRLPQAIARKLGINMRTLRRWADLFNKGGIELLRGNRPSNGLRLPLKEGVTIQKLYLLAEQQQDPLIKARLLGIAELAKGKTQKEAAKLAGLGKTTLWTWMQVFNTKGLAALLGKPS